MSLYAGEKKSVCEKESVCVSVCVCPCTCFFVCRSYNVVFRGGGGVGRGRVLSHVVDFFGSSPVVFLLRLWVSVFAK